MEIPAALERLPMTMGYFRLILRCYGDTEARRAALLEGTGVSDSDLRNPSADISVFQQVRQIENATALHGAGWAISQPQLWNTPAHGALAVAVLSAPTVADGLDVLRRYGHVRSPWFRIELRPRAEAVHVEFKLSVALEAEQWRPMMEIAFIAVRAMTAAMLGQESPGMGFRFACTKPPYADRLRNVLGEATTFDAKVNAVTVPKAWSTIASAHADPPLFVRAAAELDEVSARLDFPSHLRAQVERLMRTMPDGRLDAESVARALGVSRRTLARRLRDADASFRQLLDSELKSRAEQLLKSQAMSRPDMAEKLGYRDPTSFSRACRRWFASPKRARSR